jgi:hypothetical protein
MQSKVATNEVLGTHVGKTIIIRRLSDEEPRIVAAHWKNKTAQVIKSTNYPGQFVLFNEKFSGSQKTKPFDKLIPSFPIVIEIPDPAVVEPVD